LKSVVTNDDDCRQNTNNNDNDKKLDNSKPACAFLHDVIIASHGASPMLYTKSR
jgi:hypothetical protein